MMLIGSAAAIFGLLKRFRSAGSDWSRLRRGIAKSHCSLSGKMSGVDQRSKHIHHLVLNGLTIEEKDTFIRASTDVARIIFPGFERCVSVSTTMK